MDPVEWQIITGALAGLGGALVSGWFVSSLRLGEQGQPAGGVLTGLGAGLAFGLHGAGVASPEPSSWVGVGVLVVVVSVLLLSVRRLEELLAQVLKELPLHDALEHAVPGHGAALARWVGPGVQLSLRLTVGLAVLSWIASLYLPAHGALDGLASLLTSLLVAGLAGLVAIVGLWRWRQAQAEGGSAWEVLPWLVVGSVLLVGGPFLLVVAVVGGLAMWGFGGDDTRSRLSALPVMLHLGGAGDVAVEVDGQTWQIGTVHGEGTRVDQGDGPALMRNDALWGALGAAKEVTVHRKEIAVLPGAAAGEE